jgi:hypothetical protein
VLSHESTIDRRALLAGAGRGALGILAATLVAGSASGCGSGDEQTVDPLHAQLDFATGDAELARAAASGAAPGPARALTQIAFERDEHARVLATEITRAAGGTALPITSPASAAPATTTSATGAPVPPPSAGDVVAALRRSAISAGQLVPTLSGYRAGLLGSIAAACTASYTVSLGGGQPS